MGRGQSQFSQSLATPGTQTRGAKEYLTLAATAQAEGKTPQSNFHQLLAESYAAGLNCAFDEKIIEQLNEQLNTPGIDAAAVRQIDKMIEIFQDQINTKQQFQSKQLRLRSKLLSRMAEKEEGLKHDSPKRAKLQTMRSNIDSIVHDELLKKNEQYAKFF